MVMEATSRSDGGREGISCFIVCQNEEAQIRDCLDDTALGQVALRIVVFANDQNAGMVAARLDHKVVQMEKVIVIRGQQDAVILDRVQEMNWIIATRQARVRRCDDVAPGLLKQANEQLVGAVVVQVQVHGFCSRPNSCAESSFGLPCSL